MNTKILPITDLRRHTREIVQNVKENNETVYITQHGRPEVVIIDYERYEALIEQLAQQAPAIRRQKAVDLLQGWIETEDPAEQQGTGADLIQGLDRNRLSDRHLFPEDKQGQTW